MSNLNIVTYLICFTISFISSSLSKQTNFYHNNYVMVRNWVPKALDNPYDYVFRSVADTTLTSHVTSDDEQPQPEQPTRRYVPTLRKVAKSSRTFCIICGLFIASWIPMTVSIYVSLLCVTCGRAIKGTICAVTVNFMLVIKILNPWLYFLRNRYFRSILKRSMKAKCYRARVKPERDIYFTNA